MRVTQHLTNNDVLRAPPGSTVDECRPAPITRTLYGDGTPSVATYWQFTAEERIAIAAGALLRIEVLGQTMPPMLATVEA